MRPCGSYHARRTLLLFAAVLLLTGWGYLASTSPLLGPSPLRAQSEDAASADENLDALLGDDTTDDAAPPSGTTREAESAPQQESYLSWFTRAMGLFFGITFLVVSFIMVALLVMNILASRRENLIPSGLIEAFEEHLNQKQFQEAYELAKNDGSFIGLVLAAGLARLSSGYDEAARAMEEVGEEETMKLEHRLSYLALIGNISPMLGLFGTVYGMMQAFSLIATGGTTVKPQELADKISTALVTTFVGLAIAIPAIAVFNILRNRVARLVLEVGIRSEGLLSRFKKA